MNRLPIFIGALIVIGIGQAWFICASAADLPADMMKLISRRVGCQDMIKKGIATTSSGEFLHCNAVAADEQELRAKYAARPDLLRAFDGVWVKVVQRVPVRNSPTHTEQ